MNSWSVLWLLSLQTLSLSRACHTPLALQHLPGDIHISGNQPLEFVWIKMDDYFRIFTIDI